jgi:hypothetical protein
MSTPDGSCNSISASIAFDVGSTMSISRYCVRNSNARGNLAELSPGSQGQR